MIQRILSRVLGAPDSPTADLYFRNACADFIGTAVQQIAPTVFASQTACLVIRHDLRAGRLPPRRRLIYLIDDDIDAGTEDASLPYLYRQKLRLVEAEAGRRIRRFAGVAVVASPALARIFQPMMETHLLRPYWSEPFAQLDHFADARWIDLAYLGSAAHRADLQFMLPVVRRLLAENDVLRFNIGLEHRLPGDLDAHPRVRRIPGRTWPEYRLELARRRFHVALYPLLDTPFNRGRSPNKLIEHAVLGAAPVYSTSWREARRAGVHDAGLCLPNDRAAWHQAISCLVSDRAEMHRLALGAQRLGRSLNSAEPQRRLWRTLMEIREPLAA